LGELPAEERPKLGERANQVKNVIENCLDRRKAALKEAGLKEKLKREAVDVTFPGNMLEMGRLHPLTLIWQEIRDIFIGMGFEIAEGPEVENEYYNFEALNIPAAHPSREMWDSFYLSHNLLLRTHTSPVQIRLMQSRKPPCALSRQANASAGMR
jgi:phenylalanyl-tRNA synthetase alpha chain